MVPKSIVLNCSKAKMEKFLQAKSSTICGDGTSGCPKSWNILLLKDENILYLWEVEHLLSLEIPSIFSLEGFQLLQSAPAVLHEAKGMTSKEDAPKCHLYYLMWLVMVDTTNFYIIKSFYVPFLH